MTDASSDMESLEDMLAALENPPDASASVTVNRPSSAKGAPKKMVGAEPPASRGPSQAPVRSSKPANTVTVGVGAKGNRAGARVAIDVDAHATVDELAADLSHTSIDASGEKITVGMAAVVPHYATTAAAEQFLVSQGYSKHANRGKWFNASGGKASDFRIRGTTSTKVGMVHVITLRSLDDYGNAAKIDQPKEFIGVILTEKSTGTDVPCWFRDNGDATYDLAFHAMLHGSVRFEIKLCGNPMFDIEVQVEREGDSLWMARPRLPATPGQLFVIDIETDDGTRPEGVAPFEVQTMGDVEELRLMNNGDGTYRFQCVPQSAGHITVMLSLHGQPIKNSPVTVQVGDGKRGIAVKQSSGRVDVLEPVITTPAHDVHVYEATEQVAYDPPPDDPSYAPVAEVTITPDEQQLQHDGFVQVEADAGGVQITADVGRDEPYQPRPSTDVSNEDLNRLLDELGA